MYWKEFVRNVLDDNNQGEDDVWLNQNSVNYVVDVAKEGTRWIDISFY